MQMPSVLSVPQEPELSEASAMTVLPASGWHEAVPAAWKGNLVMPTAQNWFPRKLMAQL